MRGAESTPSSPRGSWWRRRRCGSCSRRSSWSSRIFPSRSSSSRSAPTCPGACGPTRFTPRPNRSTCRSASATTRDCGSTRDRAASPCGWVAPRWASRPRTSGGVPGSATRSSSATMPAASATCSRGHASRCRRGSVPWTSISCSAASTNRDSSTPTGATTRDRWRGARCVAAGGDDGAAPGRRASAHRRTRRSRSDVVAVRPVGVPVRRLRDVR